MRCISLLVLCAAALAAALGSPALTVTNPEQSLGPGVWKRIKIYYGVWGSDDYKWGWAREDMETDEWTTWGILRVAMMDHQACASPTYQWVMGGLSEVPLVGCYRNDMVSRAWTAMAPMPFSLCNGGAAWWGDTIFVVGGYLPTSGECVDTVLKYSISGNNWTYAPGPESGGGPGNGFGWQPSVVTDLTNGRIYRLGGCNQPGAANPTNRFWRYTPGQGWAQMASPIHGRVYSHIWFYNDSIWVASGFGSGNQVVTRVCEVYDIATNTWSDAGFPDMPADPDSGIWAGGNGSSPYNTGVGVIYSGANASSNISTRDHVFNHQTMTWSSPDTALPILRYRGCTIGNWFQQCLATGGASSWQQYTNTVVYDSWPGIVHPNETIMTRWVSPPPALHPDTTYDVTYRVQNLSQTAVLDLPVWMFIDSTEVRVFASDTLLVSVQPDQTIDVSFPDWTSPGRLGIGYTFTAYDGRDTSHANNCKVLRVMTTTDTLRSYGTAAPPAIDGFLSPGEWDDAYWFDFTNLRYTNRRFGPAYGWFKHDSAWMYLAFAMPRATQRSVGDQVGFYLDENYDRSWPPPVNTSEGNYWLVVNSSLADEVRYRWWNTTGPGQEQLAPRAVSCSGVLSGYLVFEGKLPIGPEPYCIDVDPADDTCGLFLYELDQLNSLCGWWPMTVDDTSGWHTPALYGTLRFQASPVAVDEQRSTQALEWSLSASQNPSRGQFVVEWSVPHEALVHVGLYDGAGRLVQTVAQGRASPGSYHAPVGGSSLPAGVYFVRLEAGAVVRTAKLVVER